MTKRHFISLADAIRRFNRDAQHSRIFDAAQLDTLADFCVSYNPEFNRKLWFDYIAGKCGPNGGELPCSQSR